MNKYSRLLLELCSYFYTVDLKLLSPPDEGPPIDKEVRVLAGSGDEQFLKALRGFWCSIPANSHSSTGKSHCSNSAPGSALTSSRLAGLPRTFFLPQLFPYLTDFLLSLCSAYISPSFHFARTHGRVHCRWYYNDRGGSLGQESGLSAKGPEETFWGVGILDLDCGTGYMTL